MSDSPQLNLINLIYDPWRYLHNQIRPTNINIRVTEVSQRFHLQLTMRILNTPSKQALNQILILIKRIYSSDTWLGVDLNCTPKRNTFFTRLYDVLKICQLL